MPTLRHLALEFRRRRAGCDRPTRHRTCRRRRHAVCDVQVLMNALRRSSAVLARWRLRRIAKRGLREMLRRDDMRPGARPLEVSEDSGDMNPDLSLSCSLLRRVAGPPPSGWRQRRGSRWGAAAPVVAAASVLFASAAGCSATTVKLASTSQDPVGCCCTYGDCRERFTQENCASEGEFQGWTYTWHAGACNKSDTYPAPDRR